LQQQHHLFGITANLISSNALQTHNATFTMRSQVDASFASRKVDIASVMNRLAGPDFPPELLLQVVQVVVARTNNPQIQHRI